MICREEYITFLLGMIQHDKKYLLVKVGIFCHLLTLNFDMLVKGYSYSEMLKI